MSVPFLNDIEQKFFINQTSSYGPRDDIKRKFFKSQGAVGFSINGLETNWLEIKIRALGGVPSSNYDADLWRQLVSLSGLRVSKNVTENKMTYYINALISHIVGTGGNITTSGSYTIHTFNSSGTFGVTGSGSVEVLVVAGGGGGASGGGGGGGYVYNASYPVVTGNYTVTVGNGGTFGSGYAGSTVPTAGENSVFDTLTANGGGKGGTNFSDVVTNGGNGGSGGGGAYSGVGTTTAGTGNQGGNGGTNGGKGSPFPAGGGGGAGGAGQDAPDVNHGGDGGPGYVSSISGSSVEYGGGGGGGVYGAGIAGGTATGGGSNGTLPLVNASDATANTGGGGGGAGNGAAIHGGNGGSGIVIVRYLT